MRDGAKGNRIRSAVLGLAALLMAAAGSAAAQETVTLAFVGRQGDAYLGFLQALAEANRQGRFLGFEFVHEAREATGGSGAVTGSESAAAMATGAGAGSSPAALFVATDAERFTAIANQHRGMPVFNLTSSDDGLREACLANAFHASASESMLADALAQWERAGNDTAGVMARVWNTQFPRYAASQLSKRFEEAQGRPMSDEAYAGWAATKLYTQTVMARRTAAPDAMLDALHGGAEFDGQKGVPMQFRASGQLNQMILLERDGKVVGQAPVRGVAESHELETLGFDGCKE